MAEKLTPLDLSKAGDQRRWDALPSFIDGARPAPESHARKRLIHAATLGTLCVSAIYIAWRLAFTVDLSVWWVALPLIAAEVHNTLGLLLYTAALWDIDVSPPWRPVDRTTQRIAVAITTYNEPFEVLLPSIAAAVSLEPAHETWVLDDGRRPEVEELATQMGARYLSRPDNRHAKAGNLNHALARIDADLIAIFDADHVAGPNFLRHTLCYFDDPKVAVVQTPQDFYNLDSFEHEIEHRFNEEAAFYRVIAPAKNYWNAAFWCGTSAVVRTQALRDVGGVATTTVTEDMQTTIRLNRRGWICVYHNEVLARGLAPQDAIQYMVQRHRWATGAMQVLRQENPLFGRKLTFGQRLSFATTLLAWFDSWRTLTFVLLPAAVVFTGASPINAPGYVYVPMFLAAFFSQFFALRLLARGYYPPILSLVFEMLRLPAILPATASVISGRPRPFRVTPKGKTDQRSHVPWLLSALAVLSGASIIWFGATVAGLTFSHYQDLPAVVGSVIFALANFLLVTTAVRRIKQARFRGERRASVRFDVFMRGEVNGKPCVVRDVSLTGTRLETLHPLTAGDTVTLSLTHLDQPIEIASIIVRVDSDRGFNDVALAFLPLQSRTVGRLILFLLNSPQAYATTRPSYAADQAAA